MCWGAGVAGSEPVLPPPFAIHSLSWTLWALVVLCCGGNSGVPIASLVCVFLREMGRLTGAVSMALCVWVWIVPHSHSRGGCVVCVSLHCLKTLV